MSELTQPQKNQHPVEPTEVTETDTGAKSVVSDKKSGETQNAEEGGTVVKKTAGLPVPGSSLV